MLRLVKVSSLVPPGMRPGTRVLTDAGPQFHQHVIAAQLGEQLQQTAHRGSRASLPVVQELAHGVGMRLQLPDLQVLEAHLLSQRRPVGRHLRPHVQEQRQAAQGGRRGDGGRGPRAGASGGHGGLPRSLSAVESRSRSALPPSFTATPAPGPAPRVSVSEKRRPALQSGALALVWRAILWGLEKHIYQRESRGHQPCSLGFWGEGSWKTQS
uniref:Uncharacterized protein n=1 Tax=Panthera leo TaxID=9689 RepID=A0A8C8X592_PANLE